jgi:hypothetical protein
MKSSKIKFSATLIASLAIAVGCAGISDNALTANDTSLTMNQADLKANSEVVTTVFNGTREQEMIIVIRPD